MLGLVPITDCIINAVVQLVQIALRAIASGQVFQLEP